MAPISALCAIRCVDCLSHSKITFSRILQAARSSKHGHKLTESHRVGLFSVLTSRRSRTQPRLPNTCNSNIRRHAFAALVAGRPAAPDSAPTAVTLELSSDVSDADVGYLSSGNVCTSA